MSHRTSPLLAPLRLRLAEHWGGVYPVALPLECEHCEGVRQAILSWEEKAEHRRQAAEKRDDLHRWLIDKGPWMPKGPNG